MSNFVPRGGDQRRRGVSRDEALVLVHQWAGFGAQRRGVPRRPIAQVLPADRHAAFLADLWAHSASYMVGLLGGMVVLMQVWRSRGPAAQAGRFSAPPSPEVGSEEAPFI